MVGAWVVAGCEDAVVTVAKFRGLSPRLQAAVPAQMSTRGSEPLLVAVSRLSTAEDSTESEKVQRNRIVIRFILSNGFEAEGVRVHQGV